MSDEQTVEPETFAVTATVRSYGSVRLIRQAIEDALLRESLSPTEVIVDPIKGGRRISDRQAMERLYQVLDGQEWGSETWNDVAFIIGLTNRRLTDPNLLTDDYEERVATDLLTGDSHEEN